MTDYPAAGEEAGGLIPSLRHALLGARALRALSTLVGNAGRYPPAHPFFLGSAEEFLLALEAVLEGNEECLFVFDRGECRLGTVPLPHEDSWAALIQGLMANGIRGILFRNGITRWEAATFGRLLAGPDGGMLSGTWTDVFLNDQGIRSISVLGSLPASPQVSGLTDAEIADTAVVLTEACTAFGRIAACLRAGSGLDSSVVSAIISSLDACAARDRDSVIAATSRIGSHDFAAAHAVCVAALCLCFGRALALPSSTLSALGAAGLLHDIGTAAFPDSAAAVHPAAAALVLSSVPAIDPRAIAAALLHHGAGNRMAEHRTGAGHRLAQIVAIADAYEGLTALRVRLGVSLSPADVLRRFLEEEGRLFDPPLLKAFLAMTGLFPAGTVLSLDSGEQALVVRQGADPFRPWVRILTGAEKGKMKSLAERSEGRYRRSPACVLPCGRS